MAGRKREGRAWTGPEGKRKRADGGEFGPREGKGKGGTGRKIGPARLKRDGEREKSFAFSFEIDSNLFNSNLNSGEFKLELNNKQWNNAVRHECNTNKTTSINLENNQYLFSLTLNSL